jgi:hypothetical protein
MARPTKLTPKAETRILNALRAGVPRFVPSVNRFNPVPTDC